MSWSIGSIGSRDTVLKALEAKSDELQGAEKKSFDELRPVLVSLVEQAAATPGKAPPTITLTAGDSGVYESGVESVRRFTFSVTASAKTGATASPAAKPGAPAEIDPTKPPEAPETAKPKK